MELKRVVITGMGALTPLGNNVSDFWHNLLSGKNGVNSITHFDTTHSKTKFACELKNFDILEYLSVKDARKMDECSHYAYAAAKEALADSLLDLDSINRDRAGVILGTGIGGVTSTTKGIVEDALVEGVSRLSPFFLIKTLSNMIAGNLSILLGFRGTSYVTSAACTSAACAMADAYHLLQLGKADLILTGGTEAGIIPIGINGFNAMHALSTRNDDFKTASRPFSLGRDGFVMGEGAGIFILEELEHARARGAHIYAEIKGVGLTSDAYHITSPHPDGYGAMMAMKNAIDEGGISLEEVGHINLHGTSTPIGDIAECKAIMSLFKNQADKIVFTAPKSMTGHLLGAAAAVESIATILAMRDGIVPPTINMIERDPDIPDWNFCANGPVRKEFQYALNNAFGFGGHNASILFKKFEN